MPDSSYWVRTLQPWMGAQVAIGLRSGGAETGLLVDVGKDGPILEVGAVRRRVGTWAHVQYVEEAS